MSPAPFHILIVNDDSLKSLRIKDRLTDLGYKVTSLNDLSEINFENSNDCKADLLLMDFDHELRNESDSLEDRIKKSLNIPIVFISHTSNDPGINSNIRDNRSYILKPLENSELKITIDSLIDARRNNIAYRTHVFKTSSDLTSKEHTSRKRNPQESELNESDAYKFLIEVPIFNRLDENDLSDLCRHAYFSLIHSGQYLEFEGENHTYCFIVKSGRIAMTKTTADGKILAVELLGPGDFFDLVFAIEAGTCELSACAQVESEVLWVNTQDFRIILDNNRDLYKDFTNYLTKLVNSSYSLSNKLAHECVKIRIASLLMELLAKFSGKNKKNNSSKIIKITRNQIAEATGTTPETAIRVTREMHKDGIIDCGKPGIIRILNIEELKNFR